MSDIARFIASTPRGRLMMAVWLAESRRPQSRDWWRYYLDSAMLANLRAFLAERTPSTADTLGE